MANKEASARIKINKLLEAAQWRFFPEGSAPANIRLEQGATIRSSDLASLGDPYIITSFPTPDSVIGYRQVAPDPGRHVEEQVGDDYIVLTQRPNYRSEAAWRSEAERPDYIRTNKLRFLRPYQLKAIQALQRAVKEGKDRFLFEMATGTGKTLTAAAVIKVSLRSGNARRALFLVDRLELEDQAKKAFATQDSSVETLIPMS